MNRVFTMKRIGRDAIYRVWIGAQPFRFMYKRGGLRVGRRDESRLYNETQLVRYLGFYPRLGYFSPSGN